MPKKKLNKSVKENIVQQVLDVILPIKLVGDVSVEGKDDTWTLPEWQN